MQTLTDFFSRIGDQKLSFLSDEVFDPFDLNESDSVDGFNDIDPDDNYYNDFYFPSGECKYYLESGFNNKLNTASTSTLNFSLMHCNLRSANRNLHSLENYLQLLDHSFSIIACSESWLHDYNCTLYGINTYSLVENHRKN